MSTPSSWKNEMVSKLSQVLPTKGPYRVFIWGFTEVLAVLVPAVALFAASFNNINLLK